MACSRSAALAFKGCSNSAPVRHGLQISGAGPQQLPWGGGGKVVDGPSRNKRAGRAAGSLAGGGRAAGAHLRHAQPGVELLAGHPGAGRVGAHAFGRAGLRHHALIQHGQHHLQQGRTAGTVVEQVRGSTRPRSACLRPAVVAEHAPHNAGCASAHLSTTVDDGSSTEEHLPPLERLGRRVQQLRRRRGGCEGGRDAGD